jgi:hypothetical protein
VILRPKVRTWIGTLLQRTQRPKTQGETGGTWWLYKETRNLYYFLKTVGRITWREWEIHREFWRENLRERSHFGYVNIGWNIILKCSSLQTRRPRLGFRQGKFFSLLPHPDQPWGPPSPLSSGCHGDLSSFWMSGWNVKLAVSPTAAVNIGSCKPTSTYAFRIWCVNTGTLPYHRWRRCGLDYAGPGGTPLVDLVKILIRLRHQNSTYFFDQLSFPTFQVQSSSGRGNSMQLERSLQSLHTKQHSCFTVCEC